jgi:hypothetical protein
MTSRARGLIGFVVAIAAAGVIAWATMREEAVPVRATTLGRLVTRDVTAPPNTRIRVEIINATKTSGLARRVTRLLRDRGFDVVKYTTSGTLQDSTVVLDRSGNPQWATLVAQVLGGARTDARPDTSRYVDVTVVLGTTWRAPAQPFSP